MRRLLSTLFLLISFATTISAALAQSNPPPPDRGSERGCESERKGQVTS